MVKEIKKVVFLHPETGEILANMQKPALAMHYIDVILNEFPPLLRLQMLNMLTASILDQICGESE